MRKRVLSSVDDMRGAAAGWLDLEDLVEVEVTSEDRAWPIESALLPGGDRGWRAPGSGLQTIRLALTPHRPCTGSGWSSASRPPSALRSM